MAGKSYEFPDDCYYTESDEWVRVDGTTARIGITDYAQSELSALTGSTSTGWGGGYA